MCKKLFYLVSFVFVLSIATGVQATPIPVSVDSSVETVIGADALVMPNKSLNTYDLQVKNFTQGRRVTLISFDVSGLKRDDQMFANMSLSNLGGNSSGKVDVYGVIEDQDNISGGLKWNNAPGVNNGQPIGYPVDLDEADLSGKLLSFTSPKRDERKSAGTSAALDDFINSDTDGVVTLLLAPQKSGTNVLMKSSKYADGGTILEGEITTGINVIWVSSARDYDVDGVQDDQGFIDLLNAEGHNVDARLNYWDDITEDLVVELNAADVVIISRGTASGDFNGEGEPQLWNSVSTPLIQMSAWLLRSSRFKWINSTSIINFEAPLMQAETDPLFDGIALDADNVVDVLDPSVGVQDPNDPAQIGQTTFLGIVPEEIGNGVVLANTIDGIVWIAVWKAGVEYYDGAGEIPAGKRMMFPAGSQEIQTEPFTPWGAMNLTDNGKLVLRNAINYMVAPIPPMVAHWPMDDGAGTLVADVVGGNDGTLVGLDPNTAWIADGALDGAVSFDGIDGNNIAILDSAELDFGDEDFTISLMIRYPIIPTTQQRLVSKGTFGAPGTGSRYDLYIKGSELRFEIDNGPANVKSSLKVDNAPFVTGEWVHVVAVRDAANDLLSLYADGVLQGTGTDNSGDISNGEGMRIGASTNDDSTLTGDIDDVRIFPTALSKGEIIWLY